ncbi:MAG TPA: hypothetical protein DEA08_17345 [Planctomycetes bacterium]|nr:hypothetical protein [Planctomycetota bacterium]|tara:strand:- start:154 stop:705 length:552 start_codon:yes stop_codon:yes gene_type:complete
MNDLAAKSTRPARKKRFSTLMSDVSLEDGVLRIVGRRKLASVLLLGFALVAGYFLVMGEGIPLPVRGLMSLGVAIPLYGFVDVFFGESYLKWDTRSGELLLRRGSPFGRADYKGVAEPGMLSVTRVRAGSAANGSVPLYQVVLCAQLEDAIVNFPLDFSSCSRESSDERIAEWEQKLSLGDPR